MIPNILVSIKEDTTMLYKCAYQVEKFVCFQNLPYIFLSLDCKILKNLTWFWLLIAFCVVHRCRNRGKTPSCLMLYAYLPSKWLMICYGLCINGVLKFNLLLTFFSGYVCINFIIAKASFNNDKDRMYHKVMLLPCSVL